MVLPAYAANFAITLLYWEHPQPLSSGGHPTSTGEAPVHLRKEHIVAGRTLGPEHSLVGVVQQALGVAGVPAPEGDPDTRPHGDRGARQAPRGHDGPEVVLDGRAGGRGAPAIAE